MKRNVLSAAIATALVTGQVQAGDADFFVFLGNSPAQGVEIAINGEVIGATDDQGAANAYVDQSGLQEITLLENGETLASARVELDASQNMEMSVVLSTDEPAEINIFKTGESTPTADGYLRGQVTDVDGNPITGASIRVVGEDLETTSAEDGTYNIDLPRGVYDLIVTAEGYNSRSISEIRIISNIGTGAVIKLQDPASVASSGSAAPLEEMLILGRLSADDNDAFTIEQMSSTVVDALDMEQILRFGDSNVASAIKRVVGVTVRDGKYAVIRGMDGRYIAATLNKNLMPTTDPFVRDAELDLLPANILGGIEIQKNFSADLPADSSAGSILIKTLDMPSEYKNKLSVSAGYIFGTTGEDLYTFEGGGNSLPRNVYNSTMEGLDLSICQIEGQSGCVSQEEGAALANSLPNVWNPETESATPNYGIGYALAGTKDFDLGMLAAYGSIDYDNEYDSKIDAFLDSPFEEEGELSEDSHSESLKGYFVVGFDFNSGHKIDLKTIYLTDEEQTTRILDGFDNNEDTGFQEVNLEFEERQVFVQQLSGEHFLFEEHKLEWRYGVSQTESSVPDRRTYTYFGDFLAFSTVERMYLELDEDGQDLGVDYTLPVYLTDSISTDFKFGYLFNNKDRENEIVRLGIRPGRNPISQNDDMESLLAPENFNNDAWRLNTITTETDRYTAEQETSAAYVSAEVDYEELVTFVVGLRQESFSQELSLPNDPNTDDVSKESDEVYPSASLILRPFESWQFRLAYGQTVSRPTLTEIAPASFYDDRGNQRIGNPELENSDVDNIDLRAEYYFLDGGSMSLALFNKEIDNPVEVGVADGSGSASEALTWRNEKEATVSGIEFDINKEFFSNASITAFAGGNLAYIDSEVTLEGRSADLQVDSVRDLQGLSPWSGNLQLGLDHFDTNQKFTFLMNYFDDRIDQVRRAPEPIIFESARLTLDFNYEITFENESSLSVKVKNITDEPVEFTQGDRVVEGWKEGPELSVGYSYNF